jgi:hypothetical protein
MTSRRLHFKHSGLDVSLVGSRLTHTLLHGTLYFKVAWYTLLPKALCSSTHSTPWHTFLFSTLCFIEHFAFCVLESREHFKKEQNVPGSKVFWGAECSCSRKQSVSGIKVFQESKCSIWVQSMSLQSVPRSKVFWGTKCSSAGSINNGISGISAIS